MEEIVRRIVKSRHKVVCGVVLIVIFSTTSAESFRSPIDDSSDLIEVNGHTSEDVRIEKEWWLKYHLERMGEVSRAKRSVAEYVNDPAIVQADSDEVEEDVGAVTVEVYNCGDDKDSSPTPSSEEDNLTSSPPPCIFKVDQLQTLRKTVTSSSAQLGSQEEIKNFSTLLLKPPSSTQISSRRQLSPANYSQDACNTHLDNIQRNVKYNANQLRLMKQRGIHTSEEFEKLTKVKLENTRLIKEMTKLGEQFPQNVTITLEGDFKLEVENYDKLIEGHIDTLEKLWLHNAILEHITQGDSQVAMEKFMCVNNTSALEHLIGTAFNGDMSQFENTLQFIEILPDTRLQVTGFNKLFDEMDKHGHSRHPDVLLLVHKLKEAVQNSDSKLVSEYGDTVLQKVRHFATAVLSCWASLIRLNLSSSVVEFSRKSPLAEHVVLGFLDDVVGEAYNPHGKVVVNILNFIMTLPPETHLYIGYMKLVQLANAKHDYQGLLKVAYKMRIVLESDILDEDSPTHAKLFSLKPQIPETIRRLVWHSHCLIRSTFFNKYYLCPSQVYGIKLNVIYVLPLEYSNLCRDFKWKFIPDDWSYYNDNALKFAIKDLNENIYLSDRQGNIDHGRRGEVRIADNDFKDHFYWEFHMKAFNVTRGILNIFSFERQAYLYSVTDIRMYCSGRKWMGVCAILWLPGTVEYDAFWEIRCVE